MNEWTESDKGCKGRRSQGEAKIVIYLAALSITTHLRQGRLSPGKSLPSIRRGNMPQLVACSFYKLGTAFRNMIQVFLPKQNMSLQLVRNDANAKMLVYCGPHIALRNTIISLPSKHPEPIVIYSRKLLFTHCNLIQE